MEQSFSVFSDVLFSDVLRRRSVHWTVCAACMGPSVPRALDRLCRVHWTVCAAFHFSALRRRHFSILSRRSVYWTVDLQRACRRGLAGAAGASRRGAKSLRCPPPSGSAWKGSLIMHRSVLHHEVAPGRGLGPCPKSALEPGLRESNPAPLRSGLGQWGAPNSAVKVAARSRNMYPESDDREAHSL